MKIGITGCAGRMGQMLVRQVLATDGCVLVGGTEGPGHTSLGQDVAQIAGLDACGLAVTDNSDALFAASDAVIDFTIAQVTESHARFTKKYGTNLILGTTGHDGSQLRVCAHTTQRRLLPRFRERYRAECRPEACGGGFRSADIWVNPSGQATLGCSER